MNQKVPPNLSIRIELDGEEKWIAAKDLKAITGADFIPWIEMQDDGVAKAVYREGKRLKEAGFWDWLWNFWGLPKNQVPTEQIWRGSYYQKEIETVFFPDVILRKIDDRIGWGVFAARDFKKGAYLAEYSGVLRRRQKSDDANAYCFEYVYVSEETTDFVIDAREQGGICRYINHSKEGNLEPSLATIGYLTHILFLAKRPIQKGEQLLYDYGPDYWAQRPAPQRIY